MDRAEVDPTIPIIATLLVHAALALGLYAAQRWVHHHPPEVAERPGEMIDVELPKPRVEPPKPKPEPEPEPEPEPPPEPPVVTARTVAPPQQHTRARSTPPPPEAPKITATEAPAPGPPDSAEPAPVFVLPEGGGSGGSIPVPVGTPRRGLTGPGGSGTGSGGGGKPGGTAPAVAAPVSVAAIKRRAMPIGDTDFVEAHRDYPVEARRLGIEGQVKIRLLVDKSGKVTSRKLITKLGHGLDQLAMKLAGRLRFEPAIDTDDRPVASVVVWTFTFTLPQ